MEKVQEAVETEFRQCLLSSPDWRAIDDSNMNGTAKDHELVQSLDA